MKHTTPFVPDTFDGNLVMWPLLAAVCLAGLQPTLRFYALWLLFYWLIIRGLVSDAELQPLRKPFSVVIHASFFYISIVRFWNTLPGQIFTVLSAGLTVISTLKWLGIVLPGHAGWAFDFTILLQVLTVLWISGRSGLLRIRDRHRGTAALRDLPSTGAGGVSYQKHQRFY